MKGYSTELSTTMEILYICICKKFPIKEHCSALSLSLPLIIQCPNRRKHTGTKNSKPFLSGLSLSTAKANTKLHTKVTTSHLPSASPGSSPIHFCPLMFASTLIYSKCSFYNSKGSPKKISPVF